VHSNFLFYLRFSQQCTEEEIFKEYRQWDQTHSSTFTRLTPKPKANSSPSRIRLGFSSPNFKHHVVAHYLQPFLQHFDRTRFEVILYSDTRQPDAITQQFATTQGVTLKHTSNLSHCAWAKLVHEDAVDILVDLNGHMGENRMLGFAQKPATVQITQWGYPSTTGLSAMDYRLSDSLMDLIGQSEAWHSEQLLRLDPCVFSYLPHPSSPQITHTPALNNGYVTFGSFNNFAKISDACLHTWAQLLHQLPTARLHLFVQAESKQLWQRLEKFDLPLDRIQLLLPTNRLGYLAYHQQVDIALDSFPYTGGFTTLEALWMGVPVITLAGETSAQRHGVSILNAVAQTDWITHSPDAYLHTATKLASDLPTLNHHRQTLRPLLQSSPLMDYPSYVKKLEEIYCFNL
jgi:predicted O-linked N-acetylglucosamine transferase (SPINDLY family)